MRCVRCHNVWFASPTAQPQEASLVPAQSEADASDAAVAAFSAELSGNSTPETGPETAQDDFEIAETPPESETELREATQDLASQDPASQDPASPTLDDLIGTNETGSDTTPALDENAATAPTDDLAAASETSGAELPPAEAPPLAPMQADDAQQAIPSTRSQPEDIETVAARRLRRGAVRRRSAMQAPSLPVVILGLIAIVAVLISWRNGVVRYAPQMASLYAAVGLPVNLRGLTFLDVKTTKDSHDDVPVLVVEGSIVNATTTAVEVPRLRFAVRNDNGNEVYAWTALPTQSVLAPGGTLPFRSRLASPPNDSREMMVRFFTRRDAVAGLR